MWEFLQVAGRSLVVMGTGLLAVAAVHQLTDPKTKDLKDIKFLLYDDPSDKTKCSVLIHGETDTITSSRFDPTKPTILLIHGFNTDAWGEFASTVKDAYWEKHRNDYNIICVDWGQLSGRAPFGYSGALRRQARVARRIADFLLWLAIKMNLDLAKVHLVGHSIGAHICGLVGYIVQAEGKTLGRISGLDQAWNEFLNYRKLLITDAAFVDAYHTSSPLGSMNKVGQVDFYINGGRRQPNCRGLDLLGTGWICFGFAQTVLDGPEKNDVTNQRPNSEGNHASTSASTRPRVILGEYCRPGTTGPLKVKYPIRQKRKLVSRSEDEPQNKILARDPETENSEILLRQRIRITSPRYFGLAQRDLALLRTLASLDGIPESSGIYYSAPIPFVGSSAYDHASGC